MANNACFVSIKTIGDSGGRSFDTIRILPFIDQNREIHGFSWHSKYLFYKAPC
jgi:hypothetical protein